MERVASQLVQRGMATPTILFLESMGPLSFLGSQALYALSPILGLVCNPTELERMAGILERRESIAAFIEIIEGKEQERWGGRG